MKYLVDTHMHIYDEAYMENRDEIIENINEELDFAVSISCDYESALECIKLANKYKKIYATIGYHPCDISKYDDKKMLKLLELSKRNKKIVAVGEIGLDYHWMVDPKKVQIKYFEKQLNLAQKYDLPVVIHTRDSLEDTVDILLKYPKIRGIMHCYSGDFETVKALLDRFYVGIGGTVTFKKNFVTKKLVEDISLDKIVIETDSPYLTPMPYRGKLNNPVYVKHVVEEIAKIKNIDVDIVKRVTTKNAMEIYRICLK